MFKRSRQFSLLLILCCVVLTSSGCFVLLLGAAAGAGGVAYVKGVLEQNFDKPLAKVHKASLAGLKNAGVFVTQDTLNVHDARIKGEMEGGDDVVVEITSLTEKSSKLSIRVGVFGDEAKSQMILEAIKKKL